MSRAEDSESRALPAIVTPEAVQDVRDWLDLKMRTGRYSIGLVLELAYHMVARCYHVHTIYDEIGILEGTDMRPSRTVAAEAFKREPLIGFWHKHHYQPYFIIENLRSEFRDTDIFEKSVKNYIGLETEDFAGLLAYDLTIGAYIARSDRQEITGQWIIYEKLSDDSKYYIALGTHSGGVKGHYHVLRRKIEFHKELDRKFKFSQ